MIPSVEECFRLMDEHQMLDNIKAHTVVVGQIAEFVADGLQSAGVEISLDLTLAGALLHDIGKTICLNTDNDHAEVGAKICMRHNLDEIAPIVSQHVILQKSFPDVPISETEIVYYADKRVNHDEIVSLDQRLSYIIDRYGHSDPKRHQAIQVNFQRCFAIEQELFSYLGCEPAALGVKFRGVLPAWIPDGLHFVGFNGQDPYFNQEENP